MPGFRPRPEQDGHARVPGEEPARFAAAGGGGWCLVVAVAGFLVGSLLSGIAVAIAAGIVHARLVGGAPPETPPIVGAGLAGLWAGLLGAAWVASRRWGTGNVARDYGLALHPWPDVPVGVVAGLLAQFLLVPLVYLPIEPFVPNLSQTLSKPAEQLTGHAHGAALVALAILVAGVAPVVEELFFRGLVLRALDARLAGLGRRLGPAAAIVISAAAFGTAHGEGAIVGLGLGVFGVVLAAMAERWKRLGPGIVAHATFNAATVVVLALVW